MFMQFYHTFLIQKMVIGILLQIWLPLVSLGAEKLRWFTNVSPTLHCLSLMVRCHGNSLYRILSVLYHVSQYALIHGTIAIIKRIVYHSSIICWAFTCQLFEDAHHQPFMAIAIDCLTLWLLAKALSVDTKAQECKYKSH